jgi:hypothetical protein
LTTRMKRRALAGVLALLLVWPFAHYLMVVYGHVDPWRLFGWAMYCQPRPAPRVYVVARSKDDPSELPTTGRIERQPHVVEVGELQRLLGRPLLTSAEYASRQLWGRLAGSPDALAHRIFEARPNFDRLRIGVLVPYLDPRTGAQGFRRTDYSFRR